MCVGEASRRYKGPGKIPTCCSNNLTNEIGDKSPKREKHVSGEGQPVTSETSIMPMKKK